MIYAGSAVDTFAVVNNSGVIFVHAYCLNLAGFNAWSFGVYNSAVRANFSAHSALHTFVFVDMRFLIFVKGDSPAFAHVLAPMSQTAAAHVCNFVAGNRTLVAGNVQNLNYVVNIFMSASGHTDSLAHYSSFFVNTAAHCGFVLYNSFGYVVKAGDQVVVVICMSCHLSKNLIF